MKPWMGKAKHRGDRRDKGEKRDNSNGTDTKWKMGVEGRIRKKTLGYSF